MIELNKISSTSEIREMPTIFVVQGKNLAEKRDSTLQTRSHIESDRSNYLVSVLIPSECHVNASTRVKKRADGVHHSNCTVCIDQKMNINSSFGV
jgi:hypothetical protein